MSPNSSPELLTIVDSYEHFKRLIQRASEEAILCRLSTQYTFQLSDLLVKLQALKKKAERRDHRELNNLRARSSTTTYDSEDEDDNVFRQVHPPPPPLSGIILNIGTKVQLLLILSNLTQNQINLHQLQFSLQ